MNSEEQKKIALDYIRGLSEKELVDFFYDSISNRNEFKEFDDGFEIKNLCITQSSFGKFNKKLDEVHYSEFMALPSEETAGVDFIVKAKDIHEQGECDKCKAEIISVSKEAICPICGELVECT